MSLHCFAFCNCCEGSSAALDLIASSVTVYGTDQIAEIAISIRNSRMKIASRMDYVRLDVGATLHLCHRDTLTKFADSRLAYYLKPDKRESELDFIIIDRNGKHFARILDYLRDPCSLRLNELIESEVIELKTEARFYILIQLLDLCNQRLEQLKLASKNKEDQELEPPPESKLEIIIDSVWMGELVARSQKPLFLLRRSLYEVLDHGDLEQVSDAIDRKKYGFYGLAGDYHYGKRKLTNATVRMDVVYKQKTVEQLGIDDLTDKNLVMAEVWKFIFRCRQIHWIDSDPK